MRLATFCGLLCATLSLRSGQASQALTIENFDYPSVSAAQRAWQAVEGAPPVELVDHEGGSALRIDLAFTTDSDRTVHDKQVVLDLSRSDRFTLGLFLERPSLLRKFTLQFHSGDGLFSQSSRVRGSGWHTQEFRRSAFQTLGHPAGWHKITRIRLSPWQGTSEVIGHCAVDNLVAHREDTVIVRSSHAAGREAGNAKTQAQGPALMSRLLARTGIPAVVVGDNEIEAGELTGRRLAIFAYNPRLSADQAQTVREFVARGGKVMFFGAAPSAMLRLMSLRKTGRLPRQYEGQYGSIRFDADDIEGLPAQVGAELSHVVVAAPTTDRARVVGWWYDSHGANTGIPAVIVADTGAFVSHVLGGHDAESEADLMLALVGRFLPAVWPSLARTALNGFRPVGHLPDIDAALNWLGARAARTQHRPGLLGSTRLAGVASQASLRHLQAGEHALAIGEADKAHELLTGAYLLAHSPSRAEFRACWSANGTGPFEEGWPAAMRNLHECGLNALVAKFFWAGVAHYDSEYLPHSSIFTERGDQLAQCVAAAKQYGIQVHVWKANYYLSSLSDKDFKRLLREQGRLQVGWNGKVLDWLCPSDPRNFELELNAMAEVVRKYSVDGIHFDYIRYPDVDACFCSGCRERFQKDTGIQIENWPADTRDKEDVREAWIQWRCDNISRLVQRTAEEVRKINPQCKLSAAVFGAYPHCRVSVGQDWLHWIQRGWLDFVCPMDYTNSDVVFARSVVNQLKQIRGRVPLYAGIGATSTASRLTPDRVAGQIEITRNLGADGFVLFCYSPTVAQGYLPQLARSVLSGPAVLPHVGPRFDFDLGELSTVRTYGLHVPQGETVEARVNRGPDAAGLRYETAEARIVLQDHMGKTVQELGSAPTRDQAVTVTFGAETGHFRLAVEGQFSLAGGAPRHFISRSLPIVFGDLPEDFARLL